MHHRFLFSSISIHAPAKGATVKTVGSFVKTADFNPRSRKGSDVCIWIFHRVPDISIHAPAKGATLQLIH